MTSTILTHGADLTVAPALRPLALAQSTDVREIFRWLSAERFQAVQLDAALPGLRPRELDRRARRDLIAMLGRQGLRLAGLDLFIPRKHFQQADTIDRAMSAAVAGIELAADLGRVPLSLALPVADLDGATLSALVESADGYGVTLAVHAEDQWRDLTAWLKTVDHPQIGAGLDPAALLAYGKAPQDVAMTADARVTVARLSDLAGSPEHDETAGLAGGIRCPLGDGELDVAAYRVALDLMRGRFGPVVLDVRGVAEPRQAVKGARQVWDDHAFEV